MTLTFASFSFSNLITLLSQLTGSQPSQRPVPMPEADETRADRAFLHEMMRRHPEAIQSELGLMTLMALYPRQI